MSDEFTNDLKAQLQAALGEVARLRKMARVKRSADTRTLGGVVQVLRENAGLGLREASMKCGVNPSTWSRFERDALRANLTTKQLLNIAQGVGVPLSVIFKAWEDSAGDSIGAVDSVEESNGR